VGSISRGGTCGPSLKGEKTGSHRVGSLEDCAFEGGARIFYMKRQGRQPVREEEAITSRRLGQTDETWHAGRGRDGGKKPRMMLASGILPVKKGEMRRGVTGASSRGGRRLMQRAECRKSNWVAKVRGGIAMTDSG